MRYIITLLTPDRVGILNEVTGALNGLGANIDSISQTVVAGYFTLTLTATFGTVTGRQSVLDSLIARFSPEDSVVGVMPWQPPKAAALVHEERYIVTISGIDQPGILQAVTAFLASRHINIDDWYLLFSLPQVTHIGELSIPSSLDFGHVQNEFAAAMQDLGLQARIQHENIFRATNEIGPINALLSEAHDAAN